MFVGALRGLMQTYLGTYNTTFWSCVMQVVLFLWGGLNAIIILELISEVRVRRLNNSDDEATAIE